MEGLKTRVGIEGFFCVVRSATDYHMAPQWYFTSEEMEKYMPLAVRKSWDTVKVGMKVEVFAIAGCDPLSEFFSVANIRTDLGFI